ncbi:MAG: formimidoylglutamate deiminase [Gammaproteobacteria bacterium]|nr:formimidoylglutamate deiminase [Gammaproteobacteria bacterium]MYL01640.1 formimidoylglutamate deiminase [Gammaproteobacteria bacterium]
MKELLFSKMLTDKGWSRNVLVEIDSQGMIRRIDADMNGAQAQTIGGVAIPGVPNAHSHAHQRLLAGLAETGAGRDSFLRWRELMYRIVERIDPDRFQAVAALAYMEMLKSGYTSVAEFHYLHHDAGGSPYAEPAEMGLRCIAAAEDAGIALTLLPSLYAYGGFGPAPTGVGQARFVCDSGGYMEIYSALAKAVEERTEVRLGFAPHSLRAVDEPLLYEVLAGVRQADPDAPVHMHVAEQRSEVDDCLAWCGASPVQRLLDSVAVDAHWNLVHATHMSDSERSALAATQASVVLCPTTEANLGDGAFPARKWLDLEGRFSIGSDSQITISPTDELRLLEYAQRLASESRNVLADESGGSLGRALLEGALKGGASALGQRCGVLEEGARADIVVLDSEQPALIARDGDEVLDSWIFAGGAACVRDVFVGGRQVVSGGTHVNEPEIVSRYREAARALLQ